MVKSSNDEARSAGKDIDVTVFIQRKNRLLGVIFHNLHMNEDGKYIATNLSKNTSIIATPIQNTSKALVEVMTLSVSSFGTSDEAVSTVKKVYGIDPIK